MPYSNHSAVCPSVKNFNICHTLMHVCSHCTKLFTVTWTIDLGALAKVLVLKNCSFSQYWYHTLWWASIIIYWWFIVPRFREKRGDIKSHSFVCPSVFPSVTKTLTLAITFALLQIKLWYLACVFLVTRPFQWHHVVTLTVTFDLLQGQICCRAWVHNSLNLLVWNLLCKHTVQY